MLRLLVADGNTLENRLRTAEVSGATAGEQYADVLRGIAPDAAVDISTPADADAKLPAALEAYDGIAITGSSLNIHQREPASLRQIDFMREIFGSGVPSFGSCWGLQLAAVAAGGEVAANPRGREVGFARKIILTEAGLAHAMHRARAPAFDAPAVHADEVLRLPANATVTAWNAMSAVQAAEIQFGKGVFWGVQFHPEYRLREVAGTVRRYGRRLVDEGFFSGLTALESYASDLDALEADETRRDIAWRLGIGDDILQPGRRVCEIANWIDQVRRTSSRRGKQ